MVHGICDFGAFLDMEAYPEPAIVIFRDGERLEEIPITMETTFEEADAIVKRRIYELARGVLH
jgi:hypothetical protein